jgi:hypothetical protein
MSVTKRSRQAASRYARRSGQGKRKRPPASSPPPEVKLATDKSTPLIQPGGRPTEAGVQGLALQQADIRPKLVATPIPDTGDRQQAPALTATYAYIASDLKRIGIITGVIFMLLIVLAIVFR